MVWCHVAQTWAATWHLVISWLYKTYLDSIGLDPMTSARMQSLCKVHQPMCHNILLIIYMVHIVFKFECFQIGAGVGLGLSPNPQLYCLCYMTTGVNLCARTFQTLTPGRIHCDMTMGTRQCFNHNPFYMSLVTCVCAWNHRHARPLSFDWTWPLLYAREVMWWPCAHGPWQLRAST
jgi:hypothetical protein